MATPEHLSAILPLRVALLVRGVKQMELSWDARLRVTRLSEIMNRRDRPVSRQEKEAIAAVLGFPADVVFPSENPAEIRCALARILGISRQDVPA